MLSLLICCLQTENMAEKHVSNGNFREIHPGQIMYSFGHIIGDCGFVCFGADGHLLRGKSCPSPNVQDTGFKSIDDFYRGVLEKHYGWTCEGWLAEKESK